MLENLNAKLNQLYSPWVLKYPHWTGFRNMQRTPIEIMMNRESNKVGDLIFILWVLKCWLQNCWVSKFVISWQNARNEVEVVDSQFILRFFMKNASNKMNQYDFQTWSRFYTKKNQILLLKIKIAYCVHGSLLLTGM